MRPEKKNPAWDASGVLEVEVQGDWLSVQNATAGQSTECEQSGAEHE